MLAYERIHFVGEFIYHKRRHRSRVGITHGITPAEESNSTQDNTRTIPTRSKELMGKEVSMVRIKAVTVEHHREPFGIGESRPRISWSFESQTQSWYQESYEIEIKRTGQTSGDIFHQVSSSSIFVPWPARQLQSREIVSIRVRVKGCRDRLGGVTISEWSDYLVIEAGLLVREDWTVSKPGSSQFFDIKLS